MENLWSTTHAREKESEVGMVDGVVVVVAKGDADAPQAVRSVAGSRFALWLSPRRGGREWNVNESPPLLVQVFVVVVHAIGGEKEAAGGWHRPTC